MFTIPKGSRLTIDVDRSDMAGFLALRTPLSGLYVTPFWRGPAEGRVANAKKDNHKQTEGMRS